MFQSTHPCGVRIGGRVQKRQKSGFNPRTRVGCEVQKTRAQRRRKFQSTHPCGVRSIFIADLMRKSQFQSTHPCGVRIRLLMPPIKHVSFQSTHPCGVRRVSCGGMGISDMFQSTHPCGVRICRAFLPPNPKVSIHAPVWGAN